MLLTACEKDVKIASKMPVTHPIKSTTMKSATFGFHQNFGRSHNKAFTFTTLPACIDYTGLLHFDFRFKFVRDVIGLFALYTIHLLIFESFSHNLKDSLHSGASKVAGRKRKFASLKES